MIRYCSYIAFFLMLLLLACSKDGGDSPTGPDTSDPELPLLDSGLHIVSAVHESLLVVSHESVPDDGFRDVYTVTQEGRERLFAGATLDFEVLVFLEGRESWLRARIPGTDDWVTVIDFEDSLPWTITAGGVHFWAVLSGPAMPPVSDVLDSLQITIEYANAYPSRIRIVEIQKEPIGPALPMSSVSLTGTLENCLIQSRRSLSDLLHYSNGELIDTFEGGGNHPLTSTGNHAWWLTYDGDILRWLDLRDGSGGEVSGFTEPMYGVAGLDSLILIGVRPDSLETSRRFNLYSTESFLNGESPEQALVDSFVLDHEFLLRGSLPPTECVYGVTDWDVTEGLKDLEIGVWNLTTGDIEKHTIPVEWDGFVGMVDTPEGLMVASNRILKQALGMRDRLEGTHYMQVQPRFWLYPFN